MNEVKLTVWTPGPQIHVKPKGVVCQFGRKETTVYIFMSFGSLHSGKNLGCCIIQVDSPDQANDKCNELGLIPNECNQARAYPLADEDFETQGMELNRLYTPKELEQMGFQKA